MSDTPKHADRQLRANPAEYQRRPAPLGQPEGVTSRRDTGGRGRRGQGTGKRVQRVDGEEEKGRRRDWKGVKRVHV